MELAKWAWIAAALCAAPALAADTAESTLALARERTSADAVSDRPDCKATGASDVIVVCGKRETSRYRYGQRGQPYSKQFRGMGPDAVAMALAGIELPTFNRSDWAVAFQQTTNTAAPIGTNTRGLAGILDPLGLGYGVTRSAREMFWAQQAADVND